MSFNYYTGRREALNRETNAYVNTAKITDTLRVLNRYKSNIAKNYHEETGLQMKKNRIEIGPCV